MSEPDKRIHETKIEVVVYSYGPVDHTPPGYDNYGRDLLTDILDEMNNGMYVGSYDVGESTVVPPDELKARLEAIGNDGEFFGLNDDTYKEDNDG